MFLPSTVSSPREGCLVRNLFVSPILLLADEWGGWPGRSQLEGEDGGLGPGVRPGPQAGGEVDGPAAALVGSPGLLWQIGHHPLHFDCDASLILMCCLVTLRSGTLSSCCLFPPTLNGWVSDLTASCRISGTGVGNEHKSPLTPVWWVKEHMNLMGWLHWYQSEQKETLLRICVS